MSKIARAGGTALVLMLAAAPAVAQDAAVDPMATAQASAAEQVAAGRQAAAAPEATAPCQPKKKKKGFGLGGILKAASKSGLTGMVGGGLFGQAGSVANAAVNTGVGIAESSASKPHADGC